MKDLLNCYNKIYKTYPNLEESFSSVKLIEEYRRYWKPDDVKVILLAESHVFASKEENDIMLSEINNLSDYPKNYAKFVYCLGYGEKELTNSHLHPSRDGTPDFWKILYASNNCINSNLDFAPIKKTATRDFNQRIQNKVVLLKELQRKGIWLVDASIIALYNNGIKPNKNAMKDILRVSWEHYIYNVVKTANPTKVIVIGKFVSSTLEKQLKTLKNISITTIAQPNAHLKADEHLANFQKYYELCN